MTPIQILGGLQLLFFFAALGLLIIKLRQPAAEQSRFVIAAILIAMSSVLVAAFTVATFGIGYIGSLAPMGVTLGFCLSVLLLKVKA